MTQLPPAHLDPELPILNDIPEDASERPTGTPRSHIPGGPNQLMVNYLPANTKDVDLHRCFSRIGQLDRVVLGRNKNTQQPTGYAFVYYQRNEDARRAIWQLNGAKWGTRKTIKVEWSTQRHPAPPNDPNYKPPHQPVQYEQHKAKGASTATSNAGSPAGSPMSSLGGPNSSRGGRSSGAWAASSGSQHPHHQPSVPVAPGPIGGDNTAQPAVARTTNRQAPSAPLLTREESFVGEALPPAAVPSHVNIAQPSKADEEHRSSPPPAETAKRTSE
jgi:hypothetical protein